MTTALLVFLGLLWLGPAAHVHRDAAARIASPARRRLALAVALGMPVFGPLVYGVCRPLETLAERRERKLGVRALERLLDEERCLECRTPLRPGYLCCPVCAAEVRQRCRGCGEALEFGWRACPHCAARLDEPAPVARLSA